MYEYELELEDEQEDELEFEVEGEEEGEFGTRRLYEGEFEGEEFLGTITRSIGGLLGQQEYEGEFEGEEFLGTIARGIGGLLGQGEYEFENEYEGEGEWELEGEWEGEFEGEEFFRRIARGIGRFVQRAAPVLRQVARVAAPIVGTAVGGPVGGMLARGITSQLEGESEFEGEWESEYEEEGEYEYEARVTQPEALAEYMAAAASRAASLAEAEAMIGGCTIIIVNRAGQRSLHRVLPHLVRGSAALTSVLRSRPATAPAVRAVPTVVRGTVRTLAQRAAAGYPVTPRAAAHAMAIQTRRVLGQPHITVQALRRNVRAAQAARRIVARPSTTSGTRTYGLRPGIRRTQNLRGGSTPMRRTARTTVGRPAPTPRRRPARM